MTRQSQKKISHVHKDVAEVAREACNELYDVVMENDEVYAEWRRQHPGANAKGLRQAFVSKNWSKCIPFARATIARLLATSHDSDLTSRLYNALLLDNTLVMGRQEPSLIIGASNDTKH